MLTIKCPTNLASETEVGIEHNNNCNNKNEPQNYEKTPMEARAHILSELEHKTELSYVDKNYVYDITMLGTNVMSSSLETNACSHECSECSDTSSLSSDDDYEDSQNNNIESTGTKKANQRLNDLCPIYLNDIEIDHSEEEETITELVHASSEKDFPESSQNNRMRMAFGIILRLVLPFANGVARSIKGIRDVRFLRIIKSIASSRQALTNVIAFAANTISMSLSSVHVSHHLEPILKLMKIHKSTDGVESLPDSANIIEGSSTHPNGLRNYSPFLRAPKELLPHYSLRKRKAAEQPAPKCCTLNILAQPPPGAPVRADVVFIHGLHGSLVNTWKQGLWENERRPVQFERPPKPPVRPPKRPPHSRSTALHPPHNQKRARYTQAETQPVLQNLEQNELELVEEYKVDNNNFSFICGGPKDIQVCDGMEYSFPTFRLQYDNGRQLQSELEAILNDEKSMHHRITSSDSNDRNHKKIPNNSSCLSSETNYSKCWPGDWLPIDCPGVRVIAVNYTTDQYLWRPLWKKKEPRTNLVERSREMAELLIAQRVGYGHPIIWVGHSKGGLFVKQIIVDAWESGRPAAAPFWRSARGAFFYSVPHRGSHLASIKAPFLSRSVELIDIEKNSKYLIDLHRRFAGLYHLGHLKIEVFSFVETALTLMSVLYLRIVGVDSADPGIGDVCGIHLDHREICKPRSRECILYKELVKMINKVC